MALNARYKDGSYSRQNPTWHAEDATWKARQILKLFQRNGLNPQTVCEVGCGAGGILVELARRMEPDTRFFGYEISPQAFEMCRLKESARVRFHNADPFSDDAGPFDVIMAIDVIEHVEDLYGFLRRMREHGRQKVFHIPLEICAQALFRPSAFARSRTVSGHAHFFLKETALGALYEAGYGVIDWFYTRAGIERPCKGFGVRALRGPRALLSALSQDLAAKLLGGFSLMVLAR